VSERALLDETRTGGQTVEWYTPPEVFDALGLGFDLDVASPGPVIVPWVPAIRHLTPNDNALWQPWEGTVWMNPPYGRAIDDFATKFAEHRNGIALVYSRTETAWYQRLLNASDAVCLPAKRIHFIRGDGRRVREVGYEGEDQARSTAGSTLFACGPESVAALWRGDLGPVLEHATRPVVFA
jgi:hypothetical protein